MIKMLGSCSIPWLATLLLTQLFLWLWTPHEAQATGGMDSGGGSGYVLEFQSIARNITMMLEDSLQEERKKYGITVSAQDLSAAISQTDVYSVSPSDGAQVWDQGKIRSEKGHLYWRGNSVIALYVGYNDLKNGEDNPKILISDQRWQSTPENLRWYTVWHEYMRRLGRADDFSENTVQFYNWIRSRSIQVGNQIVGFVSTQYLPVILTRWQSSRQPAADGLSFRQEPFGMGMIPNAQGGFESVHVWFNCERRLARLWNLDQGQFYHLYFQGSQQCNDLQGRSKIQERKPILFYTQLETRFDFPDDKRGRVLRQFTLDTHYSGEHESLCGRTAVKTFKQCKVRDADCLRSVRKKIQYCTTDEDNLLRHLSS